MSAPRAESPLRARQAALGVVRRLREAGHVAYFAGGCVRDELLGLHPTDYDVATDATPQRVAGLFPRTVEVGAAFGVVLVKERGATIEVATFRSDGPYTDRRRPDAVRFSDPQSDAQRRDFTINALFLDPLGEPEPGDTTLGRVIDLVGGRPDLAARRIRAVGDPDARLSEDHLRALRAVRFAARLGFEIEPGTASAIARHARDLVGVSRERIGEELRRMLAHPHRARAVAMLERLGLDGPVLDEPGLDGTGRRSPAPAPAPPGPLPTPDGPGVMHRHLGGLPADAPVPLALAAWALDRGQRTDPASVRDLAARWRGALCLSNEERDALVGILAGVGRVLGEWAVLGVAGRKRLAAGAWFSGSLHLATSLDPAAGARVREEVGALAGSFGGLAPEPLASGDDLVGAGLSPGPSFRAILDGVYDAQLEGRVRTRDQALAWALELARRPGVQP